MSRDGDAEYRDGGGDAERRDRSQTDDVVFRLPDTLRGALKQPMGPIHTDPTELLAEAGEPVIAVGDVVTNHLIETGARPALAVIDWHTEREAVSAAARFDLDAFECRIETTNPAATLTAGLLDALSSAIRNGDATVIVVAGEEDLAVLPALAVAPSGASVVYGQPGVGMVDVRVGPETRERAHDLLSRMDGDHDRAWKLLGVEPFQS